MALADAGVHVSCGPRPRWTGRAPKSKLHGRGTRQARRDIQDNAASGDKRARIDYGTGVSNPECLRFFATSYSRTLHARSDTAGRLRHAVYVSCLLELRWRRLAYCFPQTTRRLWT